MLVRVDAREDAEEADLDDDPVKGVAAAREFAPKWLVDFRRSSGRGFYQSLGDHALVLAERGMDHLLVSFDNLSSARDDAMDRDPWGYDFAARNGWSQLGVLAFRPSWFRDENLFAELRRLADGGLFSRFRRVTLTGTSMGAYAACAFASLVPGCDVIAFSPQSTLSKKLVPWEPRFSIGRKADWNGPFADAAQESRAARRVWLAYDPRFEPDRRHAARFTGENVVHLPTRYSGHKSALFLRRAGLLSLVTQQALGDELTLPGYFLALRRARSLPWYVNALADRIIQDGNGRRLGILLATLEESGAEQVARNIRRRAEAQGVRAIPARTRPAAAAAPTEIVHDPADVVAVPAEKPVWATFRGPGTHDAAKLPWQDAAGQAG